MLPKSFISAAIAAQQQRESQSQAAEKETAVSSVSSPSSGSLVTWRRHMLVFVDPDDVSLPFWWPAMIVPENEYRIFREMMGGDAFRVQAHERLVCYFEDGSFSVVPASETRPFACDSEPFLSYQRQLGQRFMLDGAVSRAARYYETGALPESFKWLVHIEEREKERLRKNHSNVDPALVLAGVVSVERPAKRAAAQAAAAAVAVHGHTDPSTTTPGNKQRSATTPTPSGHCLNCGRALRHKDGKQRLCAKCAPSESQGSDEKPKSRKLSVESSPLSKRKSNAGAISNIPPRSRNEANMRRKEESSMLLSAVHVAMQESTGVVPSSVHLDEPFVYDTSTDLMLLHHLLPVSKRQRWLESYEAAASLTALSTSTNPTTTVTAMTAAVPSADTTVA